jgi:hypothetical protein
MRLIKSYFNQSTLTDKLHAALHLNPNLSPHIQEEIRANESLYSSTDKPFRYFNTFF